jgi:hypothetical protein
MRSGDDLAVFHLQIDRQADGGDVVVVALGDFVDPQPFRPLNPALSPEGRGSNTVFL